MPRKAKGARLYYRKAKGRRKAVYVIRDGQHEFSTGTADREHAEAALRHYLIRKEQGPTNVQPDEMTVAYCLSQYGLKRAPETECPERIGYAIEALDRWWGDLPIRDITDEACKEYMKARGCAVSTVRRELGCLRAAINFTLPKGAVAPTIWMPQKPAGKDRWLTRDEAARLIRAARKDPRTRYLARFILIGLYTGSRKSVILALRYAPHAAGGWVDLENEVMYRKAQTARKTKKRAPAVRIPRKLLGHLRRWKRNDPTGWVVNRFEKGAFCVKNAWEIVRKVAELFDVTPHTLRHTAITWAMQNGVNIWEAAGFFGAAADTIESEYAHHHPDYQQNALSAVNLGGRKGRR